MLFKFETPEHQQSAIQSVAKVLLYPSFRVGFNPTFLTLGRANVFVLHSLNRKVPSILLLYPCGVSEMARNGFEDDSMRCVTGKIGGMVIEADLLPHEPMFVE